MLLPRHLLIAFHRELTKEHVVKNEFLDHQIEAAASYFSAYYNSDINISEYAASNGMSISWFIKNFKKYTGKTLFQYLTALRLTNAQVLLETTTYSINEIASMSGIRIRCISAGFFINRKDVRHRNIGRGIVKKGLTSCQALFNSISSYLTFYINDTPSLKINIMLKLFQTSSTGTIWKYTGSPR